MLGNNIGEGRGKRTGRRVLATTTIFKVEVSFEDRTKLLGQDGMNIGTYASVPKPDGSLAGEGQGVFATVDGEFATWTGLGTGRLLPGGAVNYRGSLNFSTPSAKLGALNGNSVVFEFDVDAEGNTHSQFWEWK